MSTDGKVEFNCRNGHRLRARVEQAGKLTVCPICSVKETIPRVSPQSIAPVAASAVAPSAPQAPQPARFKEAPQAGAQRSESFDFSDSTSKPNPTSPSTARPVAPATAIGGVGIQPVAPPNSPGLARPNSPRLKDTPREPFSFKSISIWYWYGLGGGALGTLLVGLSIGLMARGVTAMASGEGTPFGDRSIVNAAALQDARVKLEKIAVAMREARRAEGFSSSSTQLPFNTEAAQKLELSWRVLLLPHIGEEELFGQFRLSEPWDSKHNEKLIAKIPAIFKTNGCEDGWTRIHLISGKGTVVTEDRNDRLESTTNPGPNILNQLVLIHAGVGEAKPWTEPSHFEWNSLSSKKSLGGFETGDLCGESYSSQSIAIPDDIESSWLRAMIKWEKGDHVDLGRLARRQEQEGIAPMYTVVREKQMRSLMQLDSVGSKLSAHGYPAFANSFNGKTTQLSWRVHLLPKLGFQELYSRFNLDEPWDSETNLKLLPYMPDIYRDADDSYTSTDASLLAISGTGCLVDRYRTGSSNRNSQTAWIKVVYVGDSKRVPWTKPADLELKDIDSFAAFGLAEGEPLLASISYQDKVAIIPADTDIKIIRSLATASEGVSPSSLKYSFTTHELWQHHRDALNPK